MIGITRLKHFKRSGARIYIPQHLLSSKDFPFRDEELLKMEFNENGDLIISKPEWWELLNWETMSNAYELLPQEIKDKIQGSSPEATK